MIIVFSVFVVALFFSNIPFKDGFDSTHSRSSAFWAIAGPSWALCPLLIPGAVEILMLALICVAIYVSAIADLSEESFEDEMWMEDRVRRELIRDREYLELNLCIASGDLDHYEELAKLSDKAAELDDCDYNIWTRREFARERVKFFEEAIAKRWVP